MPADRHDLLVALNADLDLPRAAVCRLAQTLDRLRRQCASLHYAAGAPPLSFSAGLYRGAPDDLESLLHEADMRLYRAKQQGRGRTVLT